MKPFISLEGAEDLALAKRTVEQVRSVLEAGSVLRSATPEAEMREVVEIVRNTAAGIQIRFSQLGSVEGLYRWNEENTRNLQLEINEDHKLYEGAGKPGSMSHRTYCAIVVSLALVERGHRTSGSGMADLLEDLSVEIAAALSSRRS